MAETGSLPQEVKEHLETIGTADVVIGLPSIDSDDGLMWVAQIASADRRVVIACPSTNGASSSALLEGVEILRYVVPPSDRYLNTPPGLYGAFQEVFQISQRVGAKCCCVWNTNPQRISSEVIGEMLEPLINQGFDLVVPRYVEVKLGSLVNSSIIYPAVRALYGKRIHFSMAIDLSFSASFVDRLLQLDPKTRRPRCHQWIAIEAINAGLKICEANLPMEPPRPPESTDVSSILAMVLGRLFQDLERNATVWQRSNGSQNVPAFGTLLRKEEDEVTVEVQPMIETFQLGYRNLREIWTVALPPATFLELKKMTALAGNSFRMPDELWVRIVYDFALAYRQRAINREHLLRAMTPLYLAWVASHALEIRSASNADHQYVLERLALAFEKEKPYLLSRWRWPDRFNP
jgi:hypothetical protein